MRELAEALSVQVHEFNTDAAAVRRMFSGRGIPEKIRDKLGQPFFTTKVVGQGTALGLSISRGIVEAHGGSLHLDPDCEHTRFVAILPKAVA